MSERDLLLLISKLHEAVQDLTIKIEDLTIAKDAAEEHLEDLDDRVRELEVRL
jgi:hypothetical protein